jgi:hypothetical protein
MVLACVLPVARILILASTLGAVAKSPQFLQGRQKQQKPTAFLPHV